MNRKILIGSIAMLASFGLAIWFYTAETKDLYQAQHAKAQEIFNKMSLDEKIGQLLFPSYVLLVADSVSPNGDACEKSLVAENHTAKDDIIKACGLDQIQRYHLGAVLAGGRPYFNAPTLQNWVDLNALAVSQHDFNNSLDPVLLTGNDAIHGNMHLQGAVIFPHNIGLGVTHDSELMQKIAVLIGEDSLVTGFDWVYAPTLAIAQDLRWGRSYESFGQDGALVKILGHAYINGLQNIQHGRITGPLATAKHFIGDGATKYGIHGTDNTLYRFPGFAVFDWNGHTRAAYYYTLSHPALDLPTIFAKTMNAGVDMFMIGQDGDDDELTIHYNAVRKSFDAIKSAYEQGLISPARLEDAVVRILQVKLVMDSKKDIDYSVLQEEERKLALQAAQESLVLLKNNQKILPLNRDKIKNVVFVGDTNDLGVQNGGWTVNWQGQKGNQYFTGKDQLSSGAITLEQAIKQSLPSETHYYYVNTIKNTLPETLDARNSIVISVVAEPPYAEYMGDIGNNEVSDVWYDISIKRKV